MTCDSCKEDAVWLRRTQFSGTHRFCDWHARQEPDFGQDGESSFWVHNPNATCEKCGDPFHACSPRESLCDGCYFPAVRS